MRLCQSREVCLWELHGKKRTASGALYNQESRVVAAKSAGPETEEPMGWGGRLSHTFLRAVDGFPPPGGRKDGFDSTDLLGVRRPSHISPHGFRTRGFDPSSGSVGSCTASSERSCSSCFTSVFSPS